MTLCSDEHEEICFEGRSCPLCALTVDKQDGDKENERRIAELIDQRDEFESEVSTLKDKVAELENRLALHESI